MEYRYFKVKEVLPAGDLRALDWTPGSTSGERW
jgi:hypothetical protein